MKFEYMSDSLVAYIHRNKGVMTQQDCNRIAWLDRLGSDGWELVHMNDSGEALFKRNAEANGRTEAGT